MKKVIFAAIAVMAFGVSNAQESKGYIGLSIGAAFPGGDLDNAKSGFNLGLINAGYRFSENFGLTLNWGASAFEDKDVSGYTTGIGYFAVGPMLTLPVNDKLGFDFKPQYAFTSAVDEYQGDKLEYSGPGGILLSGTMNYSLAKHWGLAFNLDYLSTKFDEVEGESMDDVKVTTFTTSLGIQYKF